MNRKNRYFPPEFKREALEMLSTGEYNTAQLERELGITSGLLIQWMRNGELRREYTFPNGKPMTPAAEARIRQLGRENARLRQEQEILLKSMLITSASLSTGLSSRRR